MIFKLMKKILKIIVFKIHKLIKYNHKMNNNKMNNNKMNRNKMNNNKMNNNKM